jgi:hypothetical protein
MKKIAIAFVILALAIALFSAKATYAGNTPTGQVTISGITPTITGTTLWNQAGADEAITLETGGNVIVTANATVRDLDGGATIVSASAKLYHSTSSSGADDEESVHMTNDSCTLTGSDTYNRTVTCSFTMGYMAKSETWTVNITALDDTHSASGQDTNTVNELLALDVLEGTINFGEMSPGENSSTPANVTVQNLGNMVLGTNYSGTNYTCAVGTIPVGNTKYNNTAGSYDEMTGTAMTEEAIQDADFNLAARTGGTNATDPEFFTILIPSSDVAGLCENLVTITAVAGT